MKKFNWLFLFLFSFAFVACDDDDDVVLDTVAPNIVITNPAPNTTFPAGSEFTLTADVTDNEGLEEVRVYVTGPNGNRIAQYDDEVRDFLNNNRNYDLEVDFTLPAELETGAYTITVEAEDLAGNITVETVMMMVNEADLDAAAFNTLFADTEWWDTWDANNNNSLDQTEFGTTFFQTWDLDDDGTITQDEWNEFAGDFGMEDADWDDWDANNDNQLDQTELNAGILTSGWYTNWDVNNDGMITQEEYTAGIFNFWDDDDDAVLTSEEYVTRYETYYGE
ncbi:DUF4625 domain-containing protein [Pontibacter diazotrophicus]|uniref:DUF4625 domain-containing protein n=1 Tax=Pontibacter diazotrophicus TaxID=1400979 RepID=A0A3D8LAY7_9BACT|nr:DUF4625 domain-containing protein [Pontibacter diazotrophicus]RDV14476.1 DUF4625 domain-containing protein [Pontibacter diazotrophicus]